MRKKQDDFIETLPLGYARHHIVTDAKNNVVDYVFLEANTVFEEITGLQREDIIGSKVTEVLPGIKKSSFDWIEQYGKVAQNNKRLQFEQYSEPLGRWYEVEAYSNRTGYFTTIFKDISIRKEEENARRRQNKKMNLLLKVSKAMMSEKNPDRLSQVIVDGLAKITGVQSAAIYLLNDGLLLLNATHPPLPSGFPDHLRRAPRADHPHISRAIATKSPITLADSCTAHLTKAERDVCNSRGLRSILYIPMLYKNECIGVLIPASVDVLYEFNREEIQLCQTLASHAALSIVETRMSKKQRLYISKIEQQNEVLEEAEKRARKSKEKIANILRCAESVSFITTDNHPEHPRIIEFSHGAERLFGYHKDEVLGKKVGILHTADDVKRFPSVMAAMRKGQEGFSDESILVRKSGEQFHAFFKTTPLFEAEGHMWGTLGVSIDITERKQSEIKLHETLEVYRRSLKGMIQSMGSLIGKRDHYTADHQVQVAELAVAIAEELDMDAERIEGLRLAAKIHDVGKVAIPAEILTKPNQLSNLEYEMICTHPQVGFEILQNIEFPWPIAEITKQHHEKIDGSGYPEGLSENEILFEAKIVCVADVVDAISSHRPYRPALGVDKALEEISRNKGILYDPRVVDACLGLFRESDCDL